MSKFDVSLGYGKGEMETKGNLTTDLFTIHRRDSSRFIRDIP